jgi:hypothetical protein
MTRIDEAIKSIPKLNIIKVVRFTGDRKSAELANQKLVYRSESLWMGKDWKLVHCVNSGSHFIYHDPDFDQAKGNWPMDRNGRVPKKHLGKWTPVCTCGSPGVVVGSNAYKQWASPTTRAESTHPGMMLMCLSVLNFGVHMDGAHD